MIFQYRLLFLAALGCCLTATSNATEPSGQPVDSQSPEAIKQMADQLEADRKAREQEHQDKQEEAIKSQQTEEKTAEEAETVPAPIIQNRPLPQNQLRPTPLPAK